MTDLNVAAVLEEMVARQEIGHAIARLQRGLDRSDAALLSSAFHADAAVDYGFFVGSAADFCAIMTGASDRATHEVTMHRPTNTWIKVDGAKAISESCIFAYSPGADENGAVQSIIGGRYLDRHERRDGAWKLNQRTYVMDWNINLAGTGSTAPDFGAGLIRGARQGADPGLRLLSSWGIEDQQQTNQGGTVEISQTLAAQAEVAFAKSEIHDLIVAQCRAVDRADEALLRSLWHAGATVDLGALFAGSSDDFCAWMLGVVRSAALHSVANQWVQVDEAVGETYAALGYALRYLDRWQIGGGVHDRTFVHDWALEHPSTDQRDDPDGVYAALRTRGSLQPDDPVYAFWNEN